MEYQVKKKQILASVEYSNLLSFALVQNKLERNFKSIVQALLLTQAETTQFKEDLAAYSKASSKEFASLHAKIANVQSALQNKTGNESLKPSIKKLQNQEEDQSFVAHVPIVPINTSLNASNKEIVDTQVRLAEQYEQLRGKVNKLLTDYIDPVEVDRKLAQMKENINLLRSEVKVLSDRQSKSSRRVSLGVPEIIPIQSAPTSQSDSSHEIKALNAINGVQEEMQREINNFHIEINTLKLCLQQMKEGHGEQRRRDNKVHSQLEEVTKNNKKLDERFECSNESFEGQIKQLKNQIMNMQNRIQQDENQNNKKSKKQIVQTKQNISPNSNNQVYDRISKLQSMIQGLVTDAQFKRYKTEMKDKINCLQCEDENIRKQLKEQVQMVTQIIDTKDQQIANLDKQVDQIKNKLNDMSSHCERKGNISISRSDELKKNLQNLREDLQFYKSMNQCSENKTIIVHQSDKTNCEDNKNEVNSKSSEQIKKYVNRKLHDQRTYLLGLIRDLQKKSGGCGKSNSEQDMLNIWDKIAEINLFLNKKANQDDIKKSLTYYEKKLNSIYQKITTAGQGNEDARIAKTSWFCLSCDKSLHKYQGKVGQHLVWDSLPKKAGYTKYFAQDDKKSLPTLKR